MELRQEEEILFLLTVEQELSKATPRQARPRSFERAQTWLGVCTTVAPKRPDIAANNNNVILSSITEIKALALCLNPIRCWHS